VGLRNEVVTVIAAGKVNAAAETTFDVAQIGVAHPACDGGLDAVDFLELDHGRENKKDESGLLHSRPGKPP
jgi:hypothetical protein